MTGSISELELLTQATAGDCVAFQKLLLLHSADLTRFIAARLPSSVRHVIDPEDVLQQTYIQVFRDIGRFQPHLDGSFACWLHKVAEHRVHDAVKALRRVKRGGDYRQIPNARDSSGSLADVIELLSAGSHTPSRSAAGHEAVRAVQVAIDELPSDYREAVRLRLLEGKSLDETSALMDRSPRAVQGLVDRAKKKLRAALVRLSRFE